MWQTGFILANLAKERFNSMTYVLLALLHLGCYGIGLWQLSPGYTLLVLKIECLSESSEVHQRKYSGNFRGPRPP